MSNFQKVVEFNKQFGNSVPDTIQKEAFTEYPKTVKLCMSLITEEVKELEQAVSQNDIVETIDALADIMYVVYGMGARLGIDLDKAFDIVHSSNMSKLCSTSEEANKTVEHYQRLYISGKSLYDSPTVRESYDGQKFVVFNKSTGKVLKNVNYIEANFSTML